MLLQVPLAYSVKIIFENYNRTKYSILTFSDILLILKLGMPVETFSTLPSIPDISVDTPPAPILPEHPWNAVFNDPENIGGWEAEGHVSELVRNNPNVSHVIQTEWMDSEDLEGIDAFVVFADGNSLTSLPWVTLSIKKRRWGVIRENLRIGRELKAQGKSTGPGSRTQYRNERRRILINASYSDKDINDYFEDRVGEIEEFERAQAPAAA